MQSTFQANYSHLTFVGQTQCCRYCLNHDYFDFVLTHFIFRYLNSTLWFLLVCVVQLGQIWESIALSACDKNRSCKSQASALSGLVPLQLGNNNTFHKPPAYVEH